MPEMTLDKNSSDKEVANWISKCISTRQHENPDEEQDQSYVICARQAEEATGKKMLRGGKK